MTLGPQIIGIGPQPVGGGQPLANDYSFAQTSITHPSPPVLVSVIGTGDQDLNPANGGYVVVLNEYQPILQEGTGISILADGRVQFNKTGIAIVNAYADITHSANNTTVGATFSLERGGVSVLSSRAVHERMPAAGDIGNLSGVGGLNVQAGDILGIALASDRTGDVSVRASSVVIQLTVINVVVGVEQEEFPYTFPITTL